MNQMQQVENERITWKWSLHKEGEKIERSTRMTIPTEQKTQEKPAEQVFIEKQIGIKSQEFTRAHDDPDNRREQSYQQMGERELIAGGAMNPFLSTNNYINDLQVQDKFLTPQNSNFTETNNQSE